MSKKDVTGVAQCLNFIYHVLYKFLHLDASLSLELWVIFDVGEPMKDMESRRRDADQPLEESKFVEHPFTTEVFDHLGDVLYFLGLCRLIGRLQLMYVFGTSILKENSQLQYLYKPQSLQCFETSEITIGVAGIGGSFDEKWAV